MRTLYIFTVIALLGLQMEASTLKSFSKETYIPAPNTSSIWNPSQKNTCSNLTKLIQDYGATRRDLQRRMINDMYDSASVIRSWYGTLSAYEGQNVYIPYNSFINIKESAETQIHNADIFSEADSQIMKKLDEIILLSSKCTKLLN